MLFFELEIHLSDRPISILSYKYVRNSDLLREFVVVVITVDHQDDIGILLDRSRFSEIRHDRAFIRTRFEGTREL